MDPIKIKIAKDFSLTPGPRYIKEGLNSGELFRNEILFPMLKKAIEEDIKIVVDLDGTAGYGTSFLEEAFGGLIREEKMDYNLISSKIEIISNEEDFLIDDIKQYLKDAAKKSNR